MRLPDREGKTSYKFGIKVCVWGEGGRRDTFKRGESGESVDAPSPACDPEARDGTIMRDHVFLRLAGATDPANSITIRPFTCLR